MTLTTAIMPRYADPALEKNSVGIGILIMNRRTPAIRAVFLCPLHGSFMGEPCGASSDAPGSYSTGMPTRTVSPARLASGSEFKTLNRRHTMSKSARALASVSFIFENNPIRVINRKGSIWFVAADVGAVLGLVNIRYNLQQLDDDEKGVSLTDTPSGQQEMSIINESGLYALILRSRKPEAKRFRKWVTSEVLPAIRKTGSFSTRRAINPRDLMLTGQSELFGTLPHVIERAVHRKASKMAFEAYELSVEHLKRRVAYYAQAGVTHEIDEHRAMQVIASCNLGNALTQKFYHATQTLKTNMEIAIHVATHGLDQVKEALK